MKEKEVVSMIYKACVCVQLYNNNQPGYKIDLRGGEMARWLRAIAALPADLSLAFTSQTGWVTTTYNASSRGYNALF